MHTENNEYSQFVNYLNSKLGFNFLPLNSTNLEVPKEFEDLDAMQILLQLNHKATEIFFLSQYISEQNKAVNSFLKDAKELNIENKETINSINDFNKLHIESLANHSVGFFNNLKAQRIELSDCTIEKLDQIGEFTKSIVETHELKVPKMMKFVEKIQYWIAGTFFFLVLLVAFVTNMSYNWYKTSVRTKEEVRSDILAEIVNSKQKIYSIDYVSELQENTTILQSWLKRNEKSNEVEKFIQFKEGYNANKK